MTYSFKGFESLACRSQSGCRPSDALVLTEAGVPKMCRLRGFFVVKEHRLGEETIRRHLGLGTMLLDEHAVGGEVGVAELLDDGLLGRHLLD